MSALTSDLRHILRSLSRRPAFTIAAITTLALGLAGVVSIVAIADMVLLRPLPYPKPERLYALSANVPGADGLSGSYLLSPVEFLRIKSQATRLEQTEAMAPTEMAMATDGAPVTTRIGLASAGYLDLFGLGPVTGRPFTESEEREQAPVVILDGGFSTRQFGADPAVIGRKIVLDGRPFIVIGIIEAGQQPQLQQVDAWVPLRAAVDPIRPGVRNLIAAARLRDGATAGEALAELRSIQKTITAEFPNSHARAELAFVEMHEALYGSYRPILILLFGGVTILLLIACSNVANLTLVRAAEQSSDIVLRLSLGASRGKIIRYQLTETAVITGVSAVVGGLLSWWVVGLVLAIDPNALPSDITTTVSLRAGGVIAIILVLATAIAGLLPAYRAGRTSASGLLAQASNANVGRTGDRAVREWLLGAQVTLAVVLLGAAGLIAAEFRQLNQTNPGFEYHNTLTMQLAPPGRYPQPQQRAQLIARFLDRIEGIPGVVSAGSTQTNWRLGSGMATTVNVEGYTPAPGENVIANVRHVTPGYFETLRPVIFEGRALDRRDDFGAPPVAVVSRSFAERFWAGQTAVGRRIRRTTPANAPWLTIVGVSAEVMDNGLGFANGPTMYLPYLQQNTPLARVTLVGTDRIRSDGLRKDDSGGDLERRSAAANRCG